MSRYLLVLLISVTLGGHLVSAQVTTGTISGVVQDASGDEDFYKKFREHRYRTQWHIPLLVPFSQAKAE